MKVNEVYQNFAAGIGSKEAQRQNGQQSAFLEDAKNVIVTDLGSVVKRFGTRRVLDWSTVHTNSLLISAETKDGERFPGILYDDAGTWKIKFLKSDYTTVVKSLGAISGYTLGSSWPPKALTVSAYSPKTDKIVTLVVFPQGSFGSDGGSLLPRIGKSGAYPSETHAAFSTATNYDVGQAVTQDGGAYVASNKITSSKATQRPPNPLFWDRISDFVGDCNYKPLTLGVQIPDVTNEDPTPAVMTGYYYQSSDNVKDYDPFPLPVGRRHSLVNNRLVYLKGGYIYASNIQSTPTATTNAATKAYTNLDAKDNIDSFEDFTNVQMTPPDIVGLVRSAGLPDKGTRAFSYLLTNRESLIWAKESQGVYIASNDGIMFLEAIVPGEFLTPQKISGVHAADIDPVVMGKEIVFVGADLRTLYVISQNNVAKVSVLVGDKLPEVAKIIGFSVAANSILILHTNGTVGVFKQAGQVFGYTQLEFPFTAKDIIACERKGVPFAYIQDSLGGVYEMPLTVSNPSIYNLSFANSPYVNLDVFENVTLNGTVTTITTSYLKTFLHAKYTAQANGWTTPIEVHTSTGKISGVFTMHSDVAQATISIASRSFTNEAVKVGIPYSAYITTGRTSLAQGMYRKPVSVSLHGENLGVRVTAQSGVWDRVSSTEDDKFQIPGGYLKDYDTTVEFTAYGFQRLFGLIYEYDADNP